MERLSDLARGIARVRALGAEPARILDLCVAEGIEFWGTYPEDEFTLLFKMRLKDVEKFLSLAERSNCELELLERRGAPIVAKRARRRYVLWLLPICLLALLTAASFFVWEIEVTGNKTVSEIEILNALEDSGVYIGSFHPAFISESIRSRVLVKIPELKWISVSVFGSRAYVEVRERTDIPELVDEAERVKIVAGYPGIIDEMSVFRGFGKFAKGQTVAKGETLIDGTVPSRFDETEIVHAQGKVLARTWHEISVFMPLEYSEKQYTGDSDRRFALIIGDKRINFYRNSGILGSECDIIISEYKLGIDGIFTLPVTLVCESSEGYESVQASISEEYSRQRLEEIALAELDRRVGKDGEIVSQQFSFCVSEGCGIVTLRAECRQDIAVERQMTEGEINAALAAGEEQINE